MSFFNCLKTGFNCQKTIERLQKENKSLEARLDDPFAGLNTIEDMVKNGHAKKCSYGDLQQQWKRQFCLTLRQFPPKPNELGDTYTQSIVAGGFDYRLSLTAYKSILKRAGVHLKKWSTVIGSEDRDRVCADFAADLWGAIQHSKYWDIMIGWVAVPGHAMNIIWPIDKPIHLWEPQNMKCWIPTPDEVKTKLRVLIT
jgi:hypothetical protein